MYVTIHVILFGSYLVAGNTATSLSLCKPCVRAAGLNCELAISGGEFNTKIFVYFKYIYIYIYICINVSIIYAIVYTYMYLEQPKRGKK